MNATIITATPENFAAAEALAANMGVELAPIEAGDFPDGETKLRATKAALRTILFHRLDHPNEKIMPLILAASALRDLGAEEIILAAPYLCYMRQDKAFHTGEPISQQVIARLISLWFDGVITVEPHLHRVKEFSSLFPGIAAKSLSAAPLLAELIKGDAPEGEVLLIGPDEEAREWTQAVAETAQAPFEVMNKTRHGDRDVTVTLGDKVKLDGKHVYLVEDIVSSGATLCAAAALLYERGAAGVEALTVHALCSKQDMKKIKKAGVTRIRSTDTIPHETNAISVAPLLAQALL